ncbi:hypothetical protein [Pseudoalteromonas sp. PB2-1]|uniref:hypothetical protein n=1 Tax=Pseudoalteromonas sp. PB2-1 TaxID=2907242 RepID=UPI003866644A
MTDRQNVKFGDICREVKLTTKDPIADGYERYIGLEHLDSGSLKIKRWGMIAEDNPSFTRVFKKGHILFGKRRPYLKKAAIAEFDGICSGDIIVLCPKSSLLLDDLLPFIIQSDLLWNHAVKTSSGSLSPRTKFAELAKLELRLLQDKEQVRYLGTLRAIESTLAQVEFVKNSAEILFQRLIDRFLTNDRSETPLTGFSRSRLKNLVSVNCKSVAAIKNSTTSFDYVDISSVSFPGQVNELNSMSWIDAPSRAQRVLSANDVGVSTVRPNHRASFFVDDELIGKVASTGFSVLTPKESKYGKWIFYATLSKQFTHSLTNLATGTSYPAVSDGDVLAQQIDIPKDNLNEYISTLDNIRLSVSHLNEKMSNLNDVKINVIRELME